MSDSSIGDRIDTGEFVASVDYEDLFEGTELEPDLDFDDEGKSTAETIGGAIGAYVGRRLGEMVAREIAEVATDAVGHSEEAEGDGSEADEDESESEGEDEAESEPEGGEGEAEDEESEAEDEQEDEAESETEGEESSQVDSIPDSADELADLSYRQLQSLAKDRNIQANLSREELTQELSETLEIEG